jgi:hypothetical protein
MNDPHIQTLHYSIGHADDVDYNKAHPISHDTPSFTVNIEDGRCEVTLKTHSATVAAARAEVEPFLRAWELTAALQFRPGDFELRDEHHWLQDSQVEGSSIEYRSGVKRSAKHEEAVANVDPRLHRRYGNCETCTRRSACSNGDAASVARPAGIYGQQGAVIAHDEIGSPKEQVCEQRKPGIGNRIGIADAGGEGYHASWSTVTPA